MLESSEVFLLLLASLAEEAVRASRGGSSGIVLLKDGGWHPGRNGGGRGAGLADS